MQNQDYIKRAKKFRTKKSLGQNFLVDKAVIQTIMSEINEKDSVLEIGSGVGFVTEELVKIAKDVTAVEIDKSAIKVLNLNCALALSSCDNKCDFTVVEQDILKTDFSELQNSSRQKFKIVANIPYYITSPILAHILGEIDDLTYKNRSCVEEVILMVQYEVAKRLVATEKTTSIKEYGMLSILAQFWADVEIVKKVSKNSFYPSPKVDSALVRLKINAIPKAEPSPFLKRVIKAAFSTRRKNLKNCLLNAGFLKVQESLESLKIDSNIRGEKLSIQDFSNLAKVLYENNQN